MVETSFLASVASNIQKYILDKHQHEFRVIAPCSPGYIQPYLAAVIPPLGVIFIDFEVPYKGFTEGPENFLNYLLDIKDPNLFANIDKIMLRINQKIKERNRT